MKKDAFWPLVGKSAVQFLLYHAVCLLISLGILAVLPGVIGTFVAQAIGLMIVCFFPFLNFYQVGDRDRNKINYGHITRDPFKGLKAAAIGYSPFLLASLALILARLGVLPHAFLPYYRLINAPFLALLQSLLPTALTFGEMSVWQVLFAAFTSLIVPLAGGFGYLQGVNRVPLPLAKAKKQ